MSSLKTRKKTRWLQAGFAALLLSSCGAEPAAAPEATPSSGEYWFPQSVTLTCATPGASIRYTLDPGDPVEDWTVYTDPIVLPLGESILSARAYTDDTSGSDPVLLNYTILATDTGFSFSFDAPGDEVIDLTQEPDTVVSLSGGMTVAVTGGYDSHQWVLNGASLMTGNPMVLTPEELGLLSAGGEIWPGVNKLVVVVAVDGAYYSKELRFVVTE